MKARLYLALSLLMLASAANAYEFETGTAIICDTQKQAERLAVLLDVDERVAVSMINAEEHDPTACAVANVVYLRGAALTTTRSKFRAYEITEVLVVGVLTERGVRNTRPGKFVSLFKIDERAA
jgi:hypothetical protein